jgi:hypothetical protein
MIRHQRKVWLLALVIFFCVHNAALPQPCPANLSPSDDNLGYRRRATPERCEGFYNRPMAGESLELLSFLIGSPFDPLPGHRLVITAPDVTALGAQKVNVIARAMARRINYRMDVTVPSAGSVQWPLGAVVLAAGLKPENIGLVGSAQTSEGNIYVPLRLTTSDAEAPSPIIVFRALVDPSIFMWRLYDPSGPAPSWNKYNREIKAGDPIPLTVDSVAGKVMVLDVATRPHDGDFSQIHLKVFRP